MKSRKINKCRKINKKSYKKTQKKIYKKSEKKVHKRKYNRKKTYRKKGGANELCLKESETEPSQNEYLDPPDPEVASQKRCNEYYFEEIDDSGFYNYYAWRNPNNLLKKQNECRIVDNFGKKKKCPESLYKLKRDERKQQREQAKDDLISAQEEFERKQTELRRERDRRLLDSIQSHSTQQRPKQTSKVTREYSNRTEKKHESTKEEKKIKKQELENQLKIINDELKNLQNKYNAIDTSSSFASDYQLKRNQKDELHTEIREKEREKSNIENSISFLYI